MNIIITIRDVKQLIVVFDVLAVKTPSFITIFERSFM
jgi:hypothetical protein